MLNDDPRVHLENLKPCPTISPLADRCTECGFCESRCPSRDLTLTPRQRIVVTREITRLRSSGSHGGPRVGGGPRGGLRLRGRHDLRRRLDVPGRLPGEDRHRGARQGAARRGVAGEWSHGLAVAAAERFSPRRGGGPGGPRHGRGPAGAAARARPAASGSSRRSPTPPRPTLVSAGAPGAGPPAARARSARPAARPARALAASSTSRAV